MFHLCELSENYTINVTGVAFHTEASAYKAFSEVFDLSLWCRSP